MVFFKKQSNFVIKAFVLVLLGSFMFSNVLMLQAFALSTNKDSIKIPALRKYATDLTELARAGRIGGNADYEREVNQLE